MSGAKVVKIIVAAFVILIIVQAISWSIPKTVSDTATSFGILNNDGSITVVDKGTYAAAVRNSEA